MVTVETETIRLSDVPREVTHDLSGARHARAADVLEPERGVKGVGDRVGGVEVDLAAAARASTRS